jgi:hypothetical protein
MPPYVGSVRFSIEKKFKRFYLARFAMLRHGAKSSNMFYG